MMLQYWGPNIVRICGDGLDVQVGYDGVSNSMVAQSCPFGSLAACPEHNCSGRCPETSLLPYYACSC